MNPTRQPEPHPSWCTRTTCTLLGGPHLGRPVIITSRSADWAPVRLTLSQAPIGGAEPVVRIASDDAEVIISTKQARALSWSVARLVRLAAREVAA